MEEIEQKNTDNIEDNFNNTEEQSEDIYSEDNLTMLDFLSRMLCKELRGFLRSHYKYLIEKTNKETLDMFTDIADKLSLERVTPEVLNAMLPDLYINDLRKDIIVKNYRLIFDDVSGVLKQSTYERFREIVYRSYVRKANTGSAVETIEKIQNGGFYLPPYGIMASDNFKQIDFGELDMDNIVEELGSPLYSHFQEINELFPIKGYIPSQVTMVSGPPASGKTLLMMTEAVEAIKQGKKVLYAAIGDLKQFDFACRMCSMLLKKPMSKTALNVPASWRSVLELYPDINKNLSIQFISPDKFTANQWYRLNEQLGNIDKYDVFFIDYDSNFSTEKDSMYAKGDEVYTMAYTLSQVPGKYVFIGSQPKIANWKDQSLGMETASESSRKQQIVDVMITLSHDRGVRNQKNHIGTINIPKNRRGGMCEFKYLLDPTGIMESISPEAYMAIKDEYEPISIFDTYGDDLTLKYVDPTKIKDKQKNKNKSDKFVKLESNVKNPITIEPENVNTNNEDSDCDTKNVNINSKDVNIFNRLGEL